MSRLFMLLLAYLASGCTEECVPADFADGPICGPDGDTVQTCQFHRCIEGPFCSEGYFLSESSCPSIAPRCVKDVAGGATCIGEIIGTCDMPGIVACEDIFTEIRCAQDGQGKLALQRGACAPGARCNGQSGCDPRF